MKFFNSVKNQIPKQTWSTEGLGTLEDRKARIIGWMPYIFAGIDKPVEVKDYIDHRVELLAAWGGSDEQVYRGVVGEFEEGMDAFVNRAVSLSAFRKQLASSLGAISTKAGSESVNIDPISLHVDYEDWAVAAGHLEHATVVTELKAA